MQNQFIQPKLKQKMSDETIMWGWEPKPQPDSIRSKEHQEYLIAAWNSKVPKEKQVKTILELIQALKMELEEGIKQNRR